MITPWSLEARRARARRGLGEDTALSRYLDTPLPDRSTPLESLPLLALDLETTGLDPDRHHIVSIGFVPIDGLEIVLAGARTIVIRTNEEVGQSATLHHLTDDDLAAGKPLADALEIVFEAMIGRVLLAHYATIEQDFLDRASREVYGVKVAMTAVDTLELQRRQTSNILVNNRDGSLRLGAARSYHNLPRYRPHEAFTDALACAELYLAQVSAMPGSPTLRHVAR